MYIYPQIFRFCLIASKTAKNIMNRRPIKRIRKKANVLSIWLMEKPLNKAKGTKIIKIIPIRIIETAINWLFSGFIIRQHNLFHDDYKKFVKIVIRQKKELKIL